MPRFTETLGNRVYRSRPLGGFVAGFDQSALISIFIRPNAFASKVDNSPLLP